MKKTLLLVEALLVLAGAGCGGPEDFASADSLETLDVAEAALTAPNCTQLTATSVKANASEAINPPGNASDDQLSTRWSNLGKGSWLDYDLGANKTVSGVSIAWHSGNLRKSNFVVSTSLDGLTYTPAYTGLSSGTTTVAETYGFTARTARRVRITVNGNSVNDWASISEARACGAPTTTVSGVVWRGDFESGDRSQWSKTQMVSSDRLAVVSSPAREGRYAIKATVRQGDDPIGASGNRNELVKMTGEKSGDEYFYRWSTMFAADFPSVKTWQLFTQWHHDGCCGSPPVEFYVNGETMYLRVGGTSGSVVWSAPLARAQWQDFIFHVKWSPNSSVGFIELYHQGKLVVAKRYMATMYSGTTNYLKVGLYRNSTISPVGVVYHDGWIQGRSLQDVLPATTVAASTP
ncbi:heparin lyase I family protein [Archangium sp.]|uniref:heparin lyase I family protein n=1 Tax=Archangium sp. TaxID=1872627 RepID=UPI00286C8E70|nr:heparin lyase I family protein [Archangium sp.]